MPAKRQCLRPIQWQTNKKYQRAKHHTIWSDVSKTIPKNQRTVVSFFANLTTKNHIHFWIFLGKWEFPTSVRQPISLIEATLSFLLEVINAQECCQQTRNSLCLQHLNFLRLHRICRNYIWKPQKRNNFFSSSTWASWATLHPWWCSSGNLLKNKYHKKLSRYQDMNEASCEKFMIPDSAVTTIEFAPNQPDVHDIKIPFVKVCLWVGNNMQLERNERGASNLFHNSVVSRGSTRIIIRTLVVDPSHANYRLLLWRLVDL